MTISISGFLAYSIYPRISIRKERFIMPAKYFVILVHFAYMKSTFSPKITNGFVDLLASFFTNLQMVLHDNNIIIWNNSG